MSVFDCHEAGHIIADCPVLKRKQARQQTAVKKVNAAAASQNVSEGPCQIEPEFEPFVYSGSVSLGPNEVKKPVRVLRDTGAAQSFVLEKVLPFSEASYAGRDVLIQGVDLAVIRAPLHTVHLETAGFSGLVKVAVRPALPVSGVSAILGNDIAGLFLT